MNAEEPKRDKPIRVTWDDIKECEAIPATERPEGRDKEEPPGAKVQGSRGKKYPPVRTYGKISATKSSVEEISASRRLLLSTPFYTCVAGVVGAFVGWGLSEAIFEPGTVATSGQALTEMAAWFAVIGAAVSCAIGASEGIVARSPDQALRGGGIGLGVGLAGCALGGVIAQLLYSVLLRAGGELSMGRVMFARTLGWGVAGIFLGVAQGAAAKSGKKTLNGLLGGLGGGLLGGFLFDPIGLLTGGIRGGLVSRLIGLLAIGAAVGVLIGLVEQLLKDAWLYVIKGRLAGKQFVLYRNPTVLGSSPKCEIYIFKDPSVEPRHAAIHTMHNRYEIQDLGSREGTFVNGQRINRVRLKTGDDIRVGGTVFRYSEKRRER